MRKRNLFKVLALSALIGMSTAYISCNDDDDAPEKESQEPIENPDNTDKPDDEQNQPTSIYVKVSEIVDYVNSSADDTVTVNADPADYDHLAVRLELDKVSDKKVMLVIPDGVTDLSIDPEDKRLPIYVSSPYIPENRSLVTVKIPKSVTEIGERAFYKCSSLESINIPKGVTEIGEYAFYDCRMLDDVVIPNGVTQIRDGVFQGCELLSSIIIPDNVTEIGVAAFQNCFNLRRLTIPESVTQIGERAFFICHSLPHIDLPQGLKILENDVLHSCSSLKEVVLPDGLISIGDRALQSCGFSSIIIPNTVTKIGKEAFAFNQSLTELVILESVVEIGDDAFVVCFNLKTIYCSQAIYDKYHEVYPQMVVKK